MKKTSSINALAMGLDAYLEKNRASLTLEEVRLFDEIKSLLDNFDERKTRDEQQLMILRIVIMFSRFFGNPVVLEFIREVIHKLQNIS